MNKKTLFLLIFAVAAGPVLVYFWMRSDSSAQTAAPAASENRQIARKEPKILYYVDPMHPSYKSDKPGIAPDCGMQLTPVYADDPADPQDTEKERKILYYVDPMNPSFRSDKPGKAPDGMDLTPV